MSASVGYAVREGLSEGIQNGINRARTFAMAAETVIDDEFEQLVLSAMSDYPELSPRAVSLFAEIATVAAISRHVYSESRLGRDDLQGLLEHLRELLNGWFLP